MPSPENTIEITVADLLEPPAEVAEEECFEVDDVAALDLLASPSDAVNAVARSTAAKSAQAPLASEDAELEIELSADDMNSLLDDAIGTISVDSDN